MADYEPWNEDRALTTIMPPIAASKAPPCRSCTRCRPHSAAFRWTRSRWSPRRLNISRAEVHGIVTFYHEFRRTPPGRHMLHVCRAEACQSVGAEATGAHLRQALGVDWHETTADGAVTLEPVFCLGLCATGPAALAGRAAVGRLNPERIDRMLETLS